MQEAAQRKRTEDNGLAPEREAEAEAPGPRPEERGEAQESVVMGSLPQPEQIWDQPEEDRKDAADRELQAQRLKQLKADSPNLWKQEDVPHSGWSCTGVSDLGAPVGICQMCGYQIIRYAHHMIHPGYRSLTVGCVCAGRMEGDISEAKRREAEFKKATLHR